MRLVDMLERWAAVSGEDVTVVFEQPPSPPIRSTVIEVTHAPRPRRDSADHEIMCDCSSRIPAGRDPRGHVRFMAFQSRARRWWHSGAPAAPFRTLIEDT